MIKLILASASSTANLNPIAENARGAPKSQIRAGSDAASHRAEQFAPVPGHAMTGYVLVPATDALDAKALAAWLQRALEFTLTLPMLRAA